MERLNNMTLEELVNRLLSIDKQISTRSWITAGGDLGELIDELREEINHEPSLPSDIDEAAERIVVSLVPTFGQKYEDGSYVQGIRDYFSRDELIGLVKAGAEWMAGQGWISVDERLPEMDEEVIVLTDELGTAPIYKIAFGHIVDVERCIDYNGWNIPEVKYWMPSPPRF